MLMMANHFEAFLDRDSGAVTFCRVFEDRITIQYFPRAELYRMAHGHRILGRDYEEFVAGLDGKGCAETSVPIFNGVNQGG